LREVGLDDVVGRLLPRLARDRTWVEQLGLLACLGREDVDPVVIGPHQSELHSIAIPCLEKPSLQASVEIRPSIMPIPVEDPGRHAVVGSGINLPGHHVRIGLVLIAPQRHFGLSVTFESRLGGPDQIPFGPARAVPFLITRIGVIAREVVGSDLIPIGGRSGVHGQSPDKEQTQDDGDARRPHVNSFRRGHHAIVCWDGARFCPPCGIMPDKARESLS